MNTLLSTFPDGSSWGRLLQGITENKMSDSNGILVISETSLQVKILKPQEQDIQLMDIIRISQQILIIGRLEKTDKEEMKKGLHHLYILLKDKIKEYQLYRKSFFVEVLDFYDEKNILIEKLQEETLESRLRKQICQIATQSTLEATDIEIIKKTINGNYCLLFSLTTYNECFFDFASLTCSKEMLLPLLADVIYELKQLEEVQIQKLKSLLFHHQAPELTFFELLMKREDCNQIFEALLGFLSDDELNANRNQKLQIFNFAHSMVRYNYIFLNVEDLSPDTIKEADLYYQEARMEFASSIHEKYSEENPIQYRDWLHLRRVSSNTLVLGSFAMKQACTERWNKAEETRVFHCSRHRGTTTRFDRSLIEIMHFKMTRGEEGIQNPGKLRPEIARTSGGWRHLFCPVDYLEKNLESLMVWFNEGLIKCENKQLNPIIFAAQTYQRLVSLHPFENGNGRISRLLMDYVLERFQLPAPILEQDILDGVFPLEAKKHPEQFLKKIIKGIEKSQLLLNGKGV